MKLIPRRSLFGKKGLVGALAALALLIPSGSAQAADGFYVSGKKIMDANGNEFMMRGCNFSWCWQRGNESTVIPAAKRIGCNAIRIQLSTGSKWQKCSDSELESLIQLCIDNKLIVIFNTHDETGSDNYSDLENACNFWIEKKEILNKYRKYVLVNVSNEWYGTWSTDGWANGYKQAIPKLRNAGIKNMLVVDCAGYGQYPTSIFEKGDEVAAYDSENNTVYSMHFYQYAAGSDTDVYNNINSAMNISTPVIIGEFAYSHQGSSIAYQKIMDMAKEKGMSTLIWSWTGNSSGQEACDMFGGYDDSDWKENGTRLVKGTNGVQATSVECSVFGSSSGSGDSGNTGDNTGDNTGGDSSSDGTTVWTGDGDLNSWNSVIEIPESAFASAKEGDTVRLTFSSVSSSPEVQIAVKTVSAWTWTTLVTSAAIENSKYELKIEGTPDGCSDTLLAMLQSHGMFLKGQNAHLAKVEIISASSSDGSSSGSSESASTVWTGSENLSNWTNDIEIPASAFTDASSGDTLRFKFSDCGSAPKVQLVIKVGDSWDWTVLVDADEIADGVYEYVIPNDTRADYSVISTLQDRGMILKGQDATFTTMQLVKSVSTGVDTFKTDSNRIDFSKPVEIYTLDGRRVEEMTHGIYILRQGTAVRKVMK